jgi:hypothetical protein
LAVLEQMLVCDRQLEALWVLFKPSSGMTYLLGHAKHHYFWLHMLGANYDSIWPFWHMLVCGRQLEALWVLSEPSSGMTDLLGHAVGQT